MATLDRVTPLSTPAMVFSGSISIENLIFSQTVTITFSQNFYDGYSKNENLVDIPEIDEGENDFNFAPMAPAQADRFQNALRIHSSVAGHELPSRSDTTFNSIIDFIRAGLN